jgi:hypothetical protein
MNRSGGRCVTALVCALGIIPYVALPFPGQDRVRTQDSNGDGRPDIWRAYNNRGQLTTVRIDVDFDGRADIDEYYENGALVRRESDRDHDGRTDLVEDFDPETHERVRSVVDIDRDGTADVLTLFRGGRPVSRKRAHSPDARQPVDRIHTGPGVDIRRGAEDPHIPLTDPFRTDAALSRLRLLNG